jgi:hypothetical protein
MEGFAMRHRLLLFAPVCFVLFAGNPKLPDLPLINRLDELVQLRFKTALPGALGMSRVAMPVSMGQHFQPRRSNQRDFVPENDREREVVGKLEENGVYVGLYLFGTAIVKTAPQALDYRALKGPGIITRGSPRPAWYPDQLGMSAAAADALPDWKSVYPLARRAMQSFQDGGAGFETRLESWCIAARPVLAEARCAMCHHTRSSSSNRAAQANEPIGGVLYAFRRARQ